MSSQLHTIHKKLHADGSSVAVAEAANSSGDVGTQAVSRSSARARSCLLTAPLPQQTGASVLRPDDGALQPSDESSDAKLKFEQPDEPIEEADSCETAPGTCGKQPRPVPVPPAAVFDLDAALETLAKEPAVEPLASSTAGFGAAAAESAASTAANAADTIVNANTGSSANAAAAAPSTASSAAPSAAKAASPAASPDDDDDDTKPYPFSTPIVVPPPRKQRLGTSMAKLMARGVCDPSDPPNPPPCMQTMVFPPLAELGTPAFETQSLHPQVMEYLLAKIANMELSWEYMLADNCIFIMR